MGAPMRCIHKIIRNYLVYLECPGESWPRKSGGSSRYGVRIRSYDSRVAGLPSGVFVLWRLLGSISRCERSPSSGLTVRA